MVASLVVLEVSAYYTDWALAARGTAGLYTLIIVGLFARLVSHARSTEAGHGVTTPPDRGQIPVHWYPLLFAALLLALALVAATVEVAP